MCLNLSLFKIELCKTFKLGFKKLFRSNDISMRDLYKLEDDIDSKLCDILIDIESLRKCIRNFNKLKVFDKQHED